ncbi:thermonuclease family protein [Rhizobium herbae]|uniref:Thermonuclease family protein n=1 Tax=Rhizobium herbae TaxID=508661 RepID=A0ABS7H6M3_9HYPH|nr:thermonuclease family protein [Rhizobium herbae]MBW9062401.1 thermonuclease family protein [Rhizobium herbae]
MISRRFAAITVAALASSSSLPAAQLPLCDDGKRVNCIVDGDTLWLDGTKIRIADIDAPELSKPHCQRELALAERATVRLQSLLNDGRFELAPADRDEDAYGRKLRLVMRGSQSIGDILVSEGLARRWDGARRSWCD